MVGKECGGCRKGSEVGLGHRSSVNKQMLSPNPSIP